MYKLLQRVRNLWFWSSISSQDVEENPHSYVAQALNKNAIKGQGYIIGLSEEEEIFKNSLNADGKDTKLD